MNTRLKLVVMALWWSALPLVGCSSQSVSMPDETSPLAEATPTLRSPQAEDLAVDAVTVTPIVEGLERPWGVAWLPDGDMLITERPGRLRLVRDGVLEPEAIAGVAEVSAAEAQQLFASRQGGLLDIALHPDFEQNNWVYFTYAFGTQDANRTRVARAKFDGEKLTDWEVIFQVARTKQGGQHFGSRLTWLPDQTLLISIGDGGNPPLEQDGEFIRNQAQNLDSHLGKVVRINDDGSIPDDNPFVDEPGALPEIWSYGHRNIQGLAFDPMNQRVWATEHGSRGGDEVNLIQAEANYGWPKVSFSAEYATGRPVAPTTTAPGITDPQRVWTPSIAPSGLAIYTGDRLLDWQGNLFAGGLVSRDIRRLEVDERGNVIAESRIPIGQRVRDVRQGPDGYLYVLTDANSGQLLRLAPQSEGS
ncbi:PQQ-dependent sugar dehydrogenase [Picosynechococcus sp. NKBG042902]|uniref:PQQ-dependent sugar dehydrogenase n=1 Tax=Picosynechococcus sp. NKBG042902 TaxID=490193 RepID=UPI0004AB800D|nr:PQQ-dependent sugar dehydrogenase [Picosynechococcus sp. NKBG042902]